MFVKKTPNFTVCLVLGLLTLISYWPITTHGFVGLDDPKYILENAHIRPGLTWSGVFWAFTSGYASNWHPATWISHMIDCQFYGMNSGGHHFTNLLLHVANTILLFLLLTRLTGTFWRSVLVAALFAWHPTHVESVAWAAERKDVLSTFFFLLTLWAYARYAMAKSSVECRVSNSGVPSTFDPRPLTLYYLLALLFFALGLMSKPMLVTVPFLLLLLDFWPLRRLSSPSLHHSATPSLHYSTTPTLALITEKLPFFALSLGASLVTYFVQAAGGAVSSLTSIPLGARLANALVAYGRYLANTLWPVDLAVFYPLPDHWPTTTVVASGLLLVGLSWLVVHWRGRYPYLAVGWFWFIGTLIPTIGLVQVGSQSMADRYLYIPSIGLFIIAAWGGYDLLGRQRRGGEILTTDFTDATDSVSIIRGIREVLGKKVGGVAHPRSGFLLGGVGAILIACLAATAVQVGYWRDEETLFAHAMQVTSDNYLAYDHLAKVCENDGRKDEALGLYKELLRLKPRYPEGQYNLGTLLMGMGRLDEAAQHLEAALAVRPQWAQAHSNLGIILFRQNRLDAAVEHLENSVRLDPQDPDARVNLGVTLLAMNRAGAAANAFSGALRLKGDAPEAQFLFALALSREPRPAEALIQAEKARALALATGRQEMVVKANELVRVCQSENRPSDGPTRP